MDLHLPLYAQYPSQIVPPVDRLLWVRLESLSFTLARPW
jgi:hypothetical protein